MRSLSCLLLLLCWACVGCRDSQPPPAEEETRSAAELKAEARLRGNWRERQSKRKDPLQATFGEGTLHLSSGGGFHSSEYSFHLDPSTTPPAIDLVLEELWEDKYHAKPRTRFHGIYQLDPDTGTLKLYWAEEGRRPKAFDPERTYVFERAEK